MIPYYRDTNMEYNLYISENSKKNTCTLSDYHELFAIMQL